ncbi:leucine--tRNA ligase [Elysia marginata]|uniref:leucine--tRNA ligase n=1 Tax=Elysia marginata TaxID=1093978 RepID=A0AAV4FVU8_9GAST|nr:leucine--tRNA ligase [Elysia marginata]
MTYDFREIEKKWQRYWKRENTFKADIDHDKKPFYVLDMFPYPSGAGLHVGHPLGYIASDIYARFKRHKGFNVLHPMGFDSFGLPAEQYAIQTGQHPAITTQKNIAKYKEQLRKMGFSYTPMGEVSTSNPNFYKWTQWIFSQLFNSWYSIEKDKALPISSLICVFESEGNENIKAVCSANTPVFSPSEWKQFSDSKRQEILLKYRLCYLGEMEVNWCPNLGSVLANDEVVDSLSERGGHPVVRKKMVQWIMRISAYSERLLQGLEKLDWPEPIKESQRHWIGKSKGAKIRFSIKDSSEVIEVFTTRPDTIFGVSFMTIAPELELVKKITSHKQKDQVAHCISEVSKRNERERMGENETILGAFTGSYAIHPFTKQEIPIWIGDYVLASYGTGAVMSVPSGDQRDFDFAKQFDIPIPNIFQGVDISKGAFSQKQGFEFTNSHFLNGLGYEVALDRVGEALKKIEAGKKTINYRLRDAVFSRQRYWGEPFPIYYKDGLPQLIEEKYLPLELPEVKNYQPTETGDPPLGNSQKWAWDTKQKSIVDNSKIDHKTVFPLELNTMPGWAGSSWYFYRYMDAQNNNEIASKEAVNYWKEVDIYIGGGEHATGHLIYSRFWQKFLYDIGMLPVDEYAKKLINQGMILGQSAFIYKLKSENTFISSNKIEGQKTIRLHVDISLVEAGNKLDIEAFIRSRADYKGANIIKDEKGNFFVDREVEKMSKSKFNVISPDDICQQYGADTLRLYEMFLGPLEQSKPWNTSGISGVYSFLRKLWKLFYDNEKWIVTSKTPTEESLKTIHKTIKKIEEDIENFSFNTSVSSFMICVNELQAQKCHCRSILESLLVLLSPYAPHISEELWERLGHKGGISNIPFPTYDESYLVEQTKEYPVSFNGKMKFKLELARDLSEQDIKSLVMNHDKTKVILNGNSPKKLIIVPGKIINIVY